MMDLKDEARIRREDYTVIDRIKVSQTVTGRGEAVNWDSSLRKVRGRLIAFLDVGDIWAPDKLEKQVKFMRGDEYAF